MATTSSPRICLANNCMEIARRGGHLCNRHIMMRQRPVILLRCGVCHPRLGLLRQVLYPRERPAIVASRTSPWYDPNRTGA